MQLDCQRILIVRLADIHAVIIVETAHVPADRHRFIKLQSHESLDQKYALFTVTERYSETLPFSQYFRKVRAMSADVFI